MSHVYPSKLVRIRKPHKCWGCTEKQDVNTPMTTTASVEDGRFLKTYICNRCHAFMNSSIFGWNDFDDGLEFGGLRQYDEFKGFVVPHNKP